MQPLSPSPANCSVHEADGHARVDVGGAAPGEVHECYRTVVRLVLRHKFQRVLLIGIAEVDPDSHFVARDVIIALDLIGVPAGFKIAFVPKSDASLDAYREAEMEAKTRGLRAKLFNSEKQAIRWLTAVDQH